MVRLYCGGSGKAGFYNMQEIGLAKALSKHHINVFIFLLNPSLKEKCEEAITDNIKLIYLPAHKINNHGFFDCRLLLDYSDSHGAFGKRQSIICATRYEIL